MMVELESILDAPKEGLDPTVWRKEGDAHYLTPEARQTIWDLVEYIKGRFSIENPSVRITGSITSN